jgi:xyloglucan-specific endo-beta-1,4-glucanase
VNPVNPGGGDEPPGYWKQDDWHGCVWTGVDDANSGSTISPQDFTMGADEGYCVSGTVKAVPDWLGVSLLGFNLNEDPATADCTYEPVDTSAEGPPAVTVTKAGLAVNFVKRGDDKTFTLRAQIQGPNGASDASDRWCANLIEAQGKELIPWSEFNTVCWESETEGEPYDGQPISAVVFTVPGNGWDAEAEPNGTADDIAYDYCINGFAAADSAEEAPDGMVAQEDLTGVIGGEASGADYERVKVSAGGKSYVIQNNNWGNEAGAQSISFVNNSFTVTDGPDGSPSCNGCPLSFPSIYVGASGNTDSGKYSTRSTDGLPAAISAIQSVNTTVAWSGSPGGAANASYDIWFAKTSRGDLTDKRYNDGLDGFIMLWLHDPGGGGSPPQPIGSNTGSVMINGITWDVWVGPRGQGPSGDGADLAADPNAPVISYVATSDVGSFDGDLKAFFTDATTRSAGFTADLLLTDVFFGFEIWSPVSGLKVENFSVNVQK